MCLIQHSVEAKKKQLGLIDVDEKVTLQRIDEELKAVGGEGLMINSDFQFENKVIFNLKKSNSEQSLGSYSRTNTMSQWDD